MLVLPFLGGHDVVDYPLLIVPRRQGIFTGAVAFVAQAMSRPHRLVHANSRKLPSYMYLLYAL